MTQLKDTNPKDAVGIRKPPMSTVSAPVLLEVGLAMLEGARKYGRHNYRVAAVRASVYYDATFRHMMQWFEGEDIDPDSGLSHITKAIASLCVLRDAMIQDKLVDDRPPASPDGWLRNLQPVVEEIFNKHPEAKEAYTNENTTNTSADYDNVKRGLSECFCPDCLDFRASVTKSRAIRQITTKDSPRFDPLCW